MSRKDRQRSVDEVAHQEGLNKIVIGSQQERAQSGGPISPRSEDQEWYPPAPVDDLAEPREPGAPATAVEHDERRLPCEEHEERLGLIVSGEYVEVGTKQGIAQLIKPRVRVAPDEKDARGWGGLLLCHGGHPGYHTAILLRVVGAMWDAPTTGLPASLKHGLQASGRQAGGEIWLRLRLWSQKHRAHVPPLPFDKLKMSRPAVHAGPDA